MAGYTISLDEAQRARIEKALLALDAVDPVSDDGTLEGFGVSVLTDMVVKLPQEEAEFPGCIHGFNL